MAKKTARMGRSEAGVRHDCGGWWHLVTRPTSVSVRGIAVEVDQQGYECDGCGSVRHTTGQIAATQELAAAAVRLQTKSLTPEAIRSLRMWMNLTQEQVEGALGLGAKTVVRWESGRVMPQKATDDLLRLIRRDPSAIVFLAEHHGYDLPEAARSHILGLVSEPRRQSESVTASAGTNSPWPELPSFVWKKVVEAATGQGTDIHTFLLVTLTESARDSCWERQMRGLRAEWANAFQKHPAAPPSVDREPWQVEYEEIYGGAY
jgi:putative zinc finger/helix-turn-helix YgiT family protein